MYICTLCMIVVYCKEVHSTFSALCVRLFYKGALYLSTLCFIKECSVL